MNKKVSSEKIIQDIRRKTRKKYSSENWMLYVAVFSLIRFGLHSPTKKPL